MLRAVFLTEVLGAGIYSSVIFGGSMVLANAVRTFRKLRTLNSKITGSAPSELTPDSPRRAEEN